LVDVRKEKQEPIFESIFDVIRNEKRNPIVENIHRKMTE
jgi:hypothetical protein